MNNKYDWSNVPDSVSWISTNWEDSLEEHPKRLELTQEFIDIINDVCGVKFELSNRKRDTNILNKGGYICILDNEVKFQLNFNGVWIDDVIDVNITKEQLIILLNERIVSEVENLNKQVGNILTMQKQWLDKLGDN